MCDNLSNSYKRFECVSEMSSAQIALNSVASALSSIGQNERAQTALDMADTIMAWAIGIARTDETGSRAVDVVMEKILEQEGKK